MIAVKQAQQTQAPAVQAPIEPQKTKQPKAPAVQAPPEMQKKAEELLRLKAQQIQIDQREAELKNELKPYVKLNPIKTPMGQVYYVIGTTSRMLSKDKLRQTIIDQFHLSPDVAEGIINSGSVAKVIQPYIKVLTA